MRISDSQRNVCKSSILSSGNRPSSPGLKSCRRITIKKGTAMLLIFESQRNHLSMVMAALMGVVMMLFVVNMLVLVHLSIMLMSMDVFFCGMTAHFVSPPIFLSQYNFNQKAIKALLLSISSGYEKNFQMSILSLVVFFPFLIRTIHILNFLVPISIATLIFYPTL